MQKASVSRGKVACPIDRSTIQRADIWYLKSIPDVQSKVRETLQILRLLINSLEKELLFTVLIESGASVSTAFRPTLASG